MNAKAQGQCQDEAGNKTADQKRADRQIGGAGQNQKGNRGRNDIVEHGGRGNQSGGARWGIAMRDQGPDHHFGAERGIGDRGARRAGKHCAGQQSALCKPAAQMADQGRGQMHQPFGNAAKSEQSAGEQEKRNGEQQEFADAADRVLHQSRLRQERAERQSKRSPA